jgi:hypothetical protein
MVASGIPRQKIRLHCRWSNCDGSHVDDPPLRELLPLLYMVASGIPRQKIRLHCRWSNWDGSHVDDPPFRELLPLLYEAKSADLVLNSSIPATGMNMRRSRLDKFFRMYLTGPVQIGRVKSRPMEMPASGSV